MTTPEAGTVYWITGLSGAGKTTLGRLFYEHMLSVGKGIVFLDGDQLREVFGSDLGHTREDRLKSAMRNARICKLLSDQGINVICTTISLFHECHDWNRKNIKKYREIFLDCPKSTLSSRDNKGLYKADTDNVVGLHIAEEKPLQPDLVLNTDGSTKPEELLKQMLNVFVEG
ncbi:MAG: adenylyl-sulfate kinase [Candidatus Obscuribacterales bacterium]|nr:adenylyl-sulfate kinase [Candidatus Obscuribacterales bacterium]